MARKGDIVRFRRTDGLGGMGQLVRYDAKSKKIYFLNAFRAGNEEFEYPVERKDIKVLTAKQVFKIMIDVVRGERAFQEEMKRERDPSSF